MSQGRVTHGSALGPILVADRGGIDADRHAKARLPPRMEHFIAAGYVRDDRYDIPSHSTLTRKTVWGRRSGPSAKGWAASSGPVITSIGHEVRRSCSLRPH
jgi:hypothetical protein